MRNSPLPDAVADAKIRAPEGIEQACASLRTPVFALSVC
jgi:hypothetical protein